MKIDSYNLKLSGKSEKLNWSSVWSSVSNDVQKVKISNGEKQSLTMSANATINTADKSLNVSLSSNLFYSHVDVTEFTIQGQKRGKWNEIDPLVLGLNGKLADVDKKEKFDFDLDGDGAKDRLALLEDGNGFLALDKNNNGTIDDGSELFGAKSGDGFADLAMYDDTKDGVIDENDKIFSKLKVWLKNTGASSLVSLDDVRVGALIVESVSSKFDIKDGTDTLAKLQKTGLAVMEDGSGNWLSHVDFTVGEALDGTEATQNDEKISAMSDLKALSDNTKLNPSGNSDSSSSSNSEDALIEKLKKQLQEIEAKLRRTDSESEKVKLEGEKTALTARILQIEKRASGLA